MLDSCENRSMGPSLNGTSGYEAAVTETFISVEEMFSPFPGGRHRIDGDFSGQEFREDILIPALEKFDRVVVLLDGAEGYPSSFLEESFGGLIRAGYELSFIRKRLTIRAVDPHFETYKLLAERYLEDEARRAGRTH